jgi:Tol biopolymer transport system component
MGEVYKAEDTRLDRTVAIKVLHSHMVENEELRQRFDREAKTISSLNHPNICALYDIGHDNGTDYLVMEYLEGETLGERIAREKIPTDEVLALGLQITDALDKAHRGGVIHRDLKPGNIMLTKNGPKLLDFGLAKVATAAVDPDSSSLTSMPTEQLASQPLTERGTILGTFQYMSPEQLEGQEADARSDIFSLGAVLYEMTTGKKAFEGKSQASLIAAILEREPAGISTIEPMAPPALDHLVRACLAKDPDERVQTVHDVHLQLKWIKEGGSAVGVPAPVIASRRRTNRIAWALVGVLAVVSAFLAFTVITTEKPEHRTLKADLLPPQGGTFGTIGTTMMALSPDGTRVAFVTMEGESPVLWVRPLSSASAQPLRGTEGALFPFWSPDSRFVGFFADGKLRKIDVNGGAPITLCAAPSGRGGAWSEDNVIVFAPGRSGGLSRVPASGGDPVGLVECDSTRGEGSLRWPHFLPDGQHVFYSSQASEDAVWVASMDGTVRKRVVAGSSSVAFAQGHLLFVAENVLVARPFDTKRLEFSGDGISVTDGVMHSANWSRSGFTVSQTGELLHVNEGAVVGSTLRWYDREGRPGGTIETDNEVDDIVMSRDDRFLALAMPDDQGAYDIWLYDLNREVFSRVTFAETCDDPVFSPDGNRLAFALSGNIHDKRSSGAGEQQALFTSPTDKVLCDWSPDGRYILYMDNTSALFEDLMALPLSGGSGGPANTNGEARAGEPIPLIKTPYRDLMGQISPDGRWLAYASDESGDLHVYVQDFPDLTGKWQISREPGTMPRWRGDGEELFFVSMQREMMAVPVDGSGAQLKLGEVTKLFDSELAGWMGTRTHQYVVTSDGQRFLMAEASAAAQTFASKAHLIVNWLAE